MDDEELEELKRQILEGNIEAAGHLDEMIDATDLDREEILRSMLPDDEARDALVARYLSLGHYIVAPPAQTIGGDLLSEERIEQERIACLFRLGGGELYDTPWGDQKYWYEGVPDWIEDDDDRFSDDDHSYRTVLADCMFGAPDPPEEGWVHVYTSNSGEAECWACGPGTDWDGSIEQKLVNILFPDRWRSYTGQPGCSLCEEGDGIVSMGEGWAEVVYRTHNSNIWPENWDECESCGNLVKIPSWTPEDTPLLCDNCQAT